MIEIIIVFISLLLISFFSAAETALLSCNKIRMQHKMEKGSVNASVICKMTQNPHRVLATILIGTNLFVVTASILTTALFVEMFGLKGAIIAPNVMVPCILIFGEILPKSIARIFSDKLAFISVPLLVFFQKVFLPMVVIVEFLTDLIYKIFRMKSAKKDHFLTREDIELLVRQITKEGVLDRSEQGAIHQIFDFRYTKVSDIMIRLHDVVSIDCKEDKNSIIEKVKKFKFTRYPVLENKQLKGVLNVFDIFYNNDNNWHKFIRPLRQVYGNQKINQILYQMQRNKELIRAVVRKGKFIGIVTLKDIIDEIELI